MTDIASHEIDAFGRRVTVAVSAADIFDAAVDAIALKYAQGFHGADLEAKQRLDAIGIAFALPQPGEVARVGSGDTARAPLLLFIGTVPLGYLEYAEIRELSRRAVAAVALTEIPVRHLAMTMHGVGVGLDETEAFVAQLAGFLDALRRKEWPSQLSAITVFERNRKRAERLAHIMADNLPRKILEQTKRQIADGAALRIDSAGIGSRSKPHIFVAMQFGRDTDDLFHYGIKAPIQSAGFLCERIDSISFTGDILTQIKTRIDSASFVVAELSGANPNVYLEVGYAWGRNIRTILLVSEADRLKFDVEGQKCIVYSTIRQLEHSLRSELRQLAAVNP